MSRTVFWSLFALALAVGLALRLTRLDVRPMHHDEANQAVRFGLLLETGEYRYDPNDHHGPSIYYLTLPSAWIRGQKTLASLDERTLRIVPAIFGAGLILALSLLAGGLGRTAAATSALLAAISPALTYYSRFYIQESLLAFFALGFLVALGRYALNPRIGSAVWAGAFAGLACSTKETWVIVLVAASAACVLARVWAGRGKSAECNVQSAECAAPADPLPHVAPCTLHFAPSPAVRAVHVIAGLLAALSIALIFYSSFLKNPSGLLESIRAFRIYAGRGMDAGSHVEAWDYYLRILSWSSSGGLVWTEALVLVLAAVGMVQAFRTRTRRFWPLYVCVYGLVTACIFSAVRYKTPWNLLPFYIGFVLLAGYGAAALVDLVRPRAARGLLVLALLAAACHLGIENWRANFRYPADPRNPYVYAQTTPDFLRLVRRVTDLAALHPDRANMLVKVIAGPYEQWPLPWYLRRMTRVGYWIRAGDAGALEGVPVVVASQENAGAVDGAVGERYISEFYGLRPEVILSVYIERGLWERFLKSRQPAVRDGR